METLKNKDFNRIFWSFLTKGLTLILFVLLNIFLARSLGVELFGAWSLLISILTVFFSLSYFGVNSSAKKYVAQFSNNKEDLREIILSSIKIRLIFGLIFVFLLLLIHPLIAGFFDFEGLENLLLLSIPIVFLSGFVEMVKSICTGLLLVKCNFTINLLEFGLKLTLVILLLSVSKTIPFIVLAFSVSLFVVMAVGLSLLYFKFLRSGKKKFTGKFSGEILKYSLPFVFINLGFLALTEIDTIMIGMLSSTSEVGIYSVAKQIILKLPHISIAIAAALMPVFAKLNASNKDALKGRFKKIFGYNLLIFFFIAIFILSFAQTIIIVFFGEEYLSSILPMRILAVYLLGVSTCVILGNFMDYVGMAKVRARNISLTIALNILLNLILIPKYGAVGAALATSISYLPYVFLNILAVRNKFREV